MKNSIYDIRDLRNQSLDIQDDGLIIQEIQNDLCQKAAVLASIRRMARFAKTNGVDDATLELWNLTVPVLKTLHINELAFQNASEMERGDMIMKAAVPYEQTVCDQLKSTLTTVLNAAIQDLEKPCVIKTVTSCSKEEFTAYDKTPCISAIDALVRILSKTTRIVPKNLSFESLQAFIKKDLGPSLKAMNTTITWGGFTIIRPPKMTRTDLAHHGWESTESLNTVSQKLVALDPDIIVGLRQAMLDVGRRIDRSSNLTNEVKYHCLLAQIIMSTKNALLTIRGGHQALVNRLAG